MIDDDEFEAPPPRRPLLRRKRVLIPLGALLAILVAFLLLRTPDTDRAAMIAKYGGAHAAFAAGPAGQRIHSREQGARDGTVMLLLPGSHRRPPPREPLD